ncbi:hypothetical protein [Arthrobacter sp. ISL-72]|uniref:hypothetical protein n=1 Tax=Arthrobacter sp. ISL-72 TaxID=2819114 RepID=UPI0037C18993
MGQALMAEVESWAQAQGVAYISLASRRAGDFYRQCHLSNPRSGSAQPSKLQHASR